MSKWEGVFKYDESAPSCLLRDYDICWRNQYGALSIKYTKGKPTGRLSKRGYWEVGYGNFLYKVHRIVWELHNGEIPQHLIIDHIDGNRANNKIDNLRLVTPTGNSQNSKMPSHNKTGVVGVAHCKNKAGEITGFRATWVENKKARNKIFSFSVYGETQAFDLACKYRDKMVKMLNDSGEEYTQRHGSK